MANRNGQEDLASNSQTPPPMDPFPTYQSPFPRSRSHEENPFIQFRRFADEQLQSLFDGIPQILGFPSSDSFKKDMAEMMRKRHEMEEGWRKQLEQDVEEMRQSSRKASQQPSESIVPWWQRGRSANCPGLIELGASSNALKCPEMYDDSGKPRTELDMYEKLRKPSSEVNSATQESQTKSDQPRKPSWLSGIGWDGRRLIERSQIDESDPTSIESWRLDRPTKYTRFLVRRMDPVEDPHETIPWLMLSPYSPIYLSNPRQRRMFKVHIKDNEDVPFQISRPRFCSARNPSELDEEMAKLPWADAFEDLVSLQQTGKMVERDASTFRTPKTWIHDMVHRGSLGPRWGFDSEGRLMKRTQKALPQPQTTDSSEAASNQEKSETQIKERNVEPGWDELNNSLQEEIRKALVVAVDEAEKASPTLGMLVRKFEHSAKDILDAINAQETDGKQALVDATTTARQVEAVESEKAVPGNEGSPEALEGQKPLFSASSNTSSTWSSAFDSSSNESSSIVSTMTRTESRTLPDGSRETRRVLKRRFADGREDTEESVDVHPASTTAMRQTLSFPTGEETTSDRHTQTTSPIRDEIQQQKRKSGWFWT